MSKRVCPGPGGARCPSGSLIPRGQRRCTACARTYEQARGTRQQRGYGTKHERLRAYWQERIDHETGICCWRCGRLIFAGDTWHLGHDDHNRAITRGPECVACNLTAAGKAAHR